MKKTLLRSSAGMALATVIAAASISFTPTAPASHAVSDNVQKYEFEDGSTNGGKIYSNGLDGFDKKKICRKILTCPDFQEKASLTSIRKTLL